VPYHVSLELTPDQVRQLKVVAAEEGTTVKELTTTVVQTYLGKRSGKPAAGGGSRGKAPVEQK
jgi:hypothetical protein